MLDDLRYALKRYFIQIIEMRKILLSYVFRTNDDTIESEDPITKEEIKNFMNKFGKCPSESDLNILETCANEKRLKEISFIGIRRLLREVKETEGKIKDMFKKEGG